MGQETSRLWLQGVRRDQEPGSYLLPLFSNQDEGIVGQSMRALRRLTSAAEGDGGTADSSLVMVNALKESESRDAAVEAIKNIVCPRPMPSLLSRSESDPGPSATSNFSAAENVVALDTQATLSLCVGLQSYLRGQAENLVQHQSAIAESLAAANQLAEVCLGHVAADSSAPDAWLVCLETVTTVQQALDQSRSLAFRIAEAINLVNKSLPDTLRLPDFTWSIQLSSNGNKKHSKWKEGSSGRCG